MSEEQKENISNETSEKQEQTKESKASSNVKTTEKNSSTQAETSQTQTKTKQKPFPYFKKKFCKFCAGIYPEVTYKDVDILKKFISDRGKILPRRMTGTCAKHQRRLANAIKRARIVALLPFVIN